MSACCSCHNFIPDPLSAPLHACSPPPSSPTSIFKNCWAGTKSNRVFPLGLGFSLYNTITSSRCRMRIQIGGFHFRLFQVSVYSRVHFRSSKIAICSFPSWPYQVAQLQASSVKIITIACRLLSTFYLYKLLTDTPTLHL